MLYPDPSWTQTSQLALLHKMSTASWWEFEFSCMRQWRIQKFRKGGSATGARSAVENFGIATPTSGYVNVRTSRNNSRPSQSSGELIRECVTVPGCCCCNTLLYNHLMDSCSYLRKNTLLAAKGECICTPLTSPP